MYKLIVVQKGNKFRLRAGAPTFGAHVNSMLVVKVGITGQSSFARGKREPPLTLEWIEGKRGAYGSDGFSKTEYQRPLKEFSRNSMTA